MPIVCKISEAAPEFDLNKSGEAVDFDVRHGEWASVQIVVTTGSWGSAVVTVYRSIDGHNFVELETPVSFGTAGISDKIDVSGIVQLRIRCDTAAGSSATAKIVCCIKSTA